MANIQTKLNINPIDWATRDTGFIPGDGEIWYYYNNSSHPNTVIYVIGDGVTTIDSLTIYTGTNDQAQNIKGVKTFDNITNFLSLVSFFTDANFSTTIRYFKGENLRWDVGRNAVNDWFSISRHDAAGNFLDIPFYIDDADGTINLVKATVSQLGITLNNGVAAGVPLALASQGFQSWFQNNQSGILRTYYGGTVYRTMDTGGNAIYGANLHVNGTLSKSAGTFDIPHVLPKLNNDTGLRHSFVESPIISNSYYGTVKLKNGKAKVNIDKEFDMTEGTFEALNTDFCHFTKNENSFVRTISKIEGNILSIEAEDNKCNDIIYWEVKGRRHDKYIMGCDITDDDGKLITEYKMAKTLEEREAEALKLKKEFEKAKTQ